MAQDPFGLPALPCPVQDLEIIRPQVRGQQQQLAAAAAGSRSSGRCSSCGGAWQQAQTDVLPSFPAVESSSCLSAPALLCHGRVACCVLAHNQKRRAAACCLPAGPAVPAVQDYFSRFQFSVKSKKFYPE